MESTKKQPRLLADIAEAYAGLSKPKAQEALNLAVEQAAREDKYCEANSFPSVPSFTSPEIEQKLSYDEIASRLKLQTKPFSPGSSSKQILIPANDK